MKHQGFFRKLFSSDDREEEEEYPALTVEKRDMIRGIVELSDTTVREVMVPRIDVAFVGLDFEPKEIVERVVQYGHSRFPVYKDTIDNVIGILYVKDLLKYLLTDDPIDLDTIIRKAYFVPESKRLDALMREMKRRRVHIAVAVDEYGGVSGIVCLEDIIEEIVGDIQDEYDNEREDILPLAENIYLCDARVAIEDLNETLRLGLPEENFDTLGGFVFDLFGKIPVKYEKVSFNAIDFVIQDMEGHKIRTVKLVVPPKSDTPEE
ncbi:MAG: hemolysin family protein [Spirochaetaceae bacterium]